MIPQSSSPVPPPTDWTWSGLGVTTPPHLQTQPRLPDWSVAAVNGGSPDNSAPKAFVSSDPLDSSPTHSKKRGHVEDSNHDPIEDNDTISITQEMPEAKKQHSAPSQ